MFSTLFLTLLPHISLLGVFNEFKKNSPLLFLTGLPHIFLVLIIDYS